MCIRDRVGTEEPAIGNGGKRVGRETTMLRIEKRSSGQATILQLSGRIQAEHLRELQAQIESCTRRTILNLEEVRLVDRAAVYFLGLCELNGVEPVSYTHLDVYKRQGYYGAAHQTDGA